MLLSEEDSESVFSILEEENIDFVVIDTTDSDFGGGHDDVLVEFPLPDQAVEYVRDRFDEAGLDQRYVKTLAAESAQTERFEDLELVQTRVEFVVVPGSTPPDVQVVVHRSVGATYPTLASDLAAEISTTTGRAVNVHVEFIDIQRYDVEG